jgi:hypothetical protein
VTRALGALLCAVVLLGLSACESNQERSAKIARQGRHAIAAGPALRAGAANRDVRILSTTLINGDGGAQAVAVGLRNTGAAQANVPVLLQARAGSGPPVYTNATAGLQPSLQRVALVAPGSTVWWVDDQVIGAPARRSLHVQIGAGRPAARAPVVTVSDVHLSDDSGATALTGTLTNRSGVAQPSLPVFAVARRGSRVVAAGRALVASLPAGATPVAHAFALFFVGSPAGATIAVTVAPTAGA